MAFSTYHDPKGSSFVGQWTPKGQKELDDEMVDEWLVENMPWTDRSEDTTVDKMYQAGLGPSDIAAHLTGGIIRWDRKPDPDDPYAPQPVSPKDQSLGERITNPGYAPPELSEQEQEQMDAYAEYQRDAVLDGAKEGAAQGGGTPWGIATGALLGATSASAGSLDAYAMEQLQEEEEARIEAQAADANRLAQEAAIANKRLGAGVAQPYQDPLSANYSYQPLRYDDWYSSIFSGA